MLGSVLLDPENGSYTFLEKLGSLHLATSRHVPEKIVLSINIDVRISTFTRLHVLVYITPLLLASDWYYCNRFVPNIPGNTLVILGVVVVSVSCLLQLVIQGVAEK
jgi:hypothetical protein